MQFNKPIKFKWIYVWRFPFILLACGTHALTSILVGVAALSIKEGISCYKELT